MAQSSDHQQRRSNNRGNNRGNNRNRNRNSRGNNSGGGSQRRFVKQKVPRRTGKPSFWEGICEWFSNLFGPGTKRPSPPQRSPKNTSSDRQKKAPRKQARARERKNTRPTNSGPPEKVAVTSSRLYVGNLSYATTGDELATLFEEVGSVVKAEIVYHRRSNRSKGYAFVEMNDAATARKAAETLHDHDFMGRKIMVNGAKSAGPQDGDSDSDSD